MNFLEKLIETKTILSVTTAVLIIVVLLGLLFAWPLVIIWALNTLFPLLSISYTFWSWLAVAILNLTYTGIRKTD